MVRDRLTGEVEREERDPEARIVSLTCIGGRESRCDARESPDGCRVLVRRWPFAEHPAVEVTVRDRVTAIALAEAGDRLGVAFGHGSIETLSVPPGQSAPTVRCQGVPTGATGEALASLRTDCGSGMSARRQYVCSTLPGG